MVMVVPTSDILLQKKMYFINYSIKTD